MNNEQGAKTTPVIRSVDELAKYLGKAEANTADNPYDVILDGLDVEKDFFNLCNSLKERYVNLDMSACKGEKISFTSNVVSMDYHMIVGITLPEGLRFIDDYAFTDFFELTSIIIPDKVESIGHEAFAGCDKLTSVIIGNSVKSIGEQAFSDCFDLPEINIPDSVKSIGKQAFSGCSKLTSVKIGSGVENIGENAFSCCPNLNITWNYNPSLSTDNFRSYLKTVIIPKNIKMIKPCAFAGYDELTNVIISDSVERIVYGAFSNCNRLISVTFCGTIPSSEFYDDEPFPGDLRTKFYETDKTNGTPGIYTRPKGSKNWTREQ